MGCGSCGVSKDGAKTGGCQNGCSSGGCNKLNAFDWLADIPLSEFGKPFPIVEVAFNNGSRKEFFNNSKNLDLIRGSYITVEGVNGFDVGTVSLSGELVKLQLKKYNVNQEDVTKKILRHTTDADLNEYYNNKPKEKELLIQARAIARSLNLEMKIGEVELQADGKKLTIFYTANNRVDFRDLIKIYAQNFGARIEMKQIGARQESGKVGGIGSCGRELCCSTWLTDFKTVYTSTARYQNLSINQTKLSGQCGKLKCCLNYELDTYMDALTDFPTHADILEVKSGKLKLIKKDIFKKLMWYVSEKSTKHYPLSLERVQFILSENKQKRYPEDIEPVEVTALKSKDSERHIEAGFVNDVGQITLTSLNKRKNNKPKNKTKKPQTPQKEKAVGQERNASIQDKNNAPQQPTATSKPKNKPQHNNQREKGEQKKQTPHNIEQKQQNTNGEKKENKNNQKPNNKNNNNPQKTAPNQSNNNPNQKPKPQNKKPFKPKPAPTNPKGPDPQ